MENVKCDYCSSDNNRELLKQTDLYHKTTDEYFTVVRCSECGLAYTNPRPTEDEIGKYYSSEYNFHSSQSKIKLTLLEIANSIANSKFSFLFTYIPLINKKLVTYVKPQIKDPVMQLKNSFKTFLDIGCGSGLSAHFWGTSGSIMKYKKYLDVSGVEISDDARKVLSSNGIPSFRSIEDVPNEQKFDIIRMNWSLEHVHSPSLFFEFIKSHLSPNGKAIVLVPNMNGLLYKMAIDSVELPIHLYHFTKDDIENYANKYKLHLKQHETFSYPQMYRFLSDVNPKLKKIFNGITIDEAYSFQKTLSRFDKLGLGNDMLFVLEHK